MIGGEDDDRRFCVGGCEKIVPEFPEGVVEVVDPVERRLLAVAVLLATGRDALPDVVSYRVCAGKNRGAGVVEWPPASEHCDERVGELLVSQGVRVGGLCPLEQAA